MPTQRIGVREKKFAENETGHRAVKEKIVPLDGGADRCGDDGAAKLGLMFAGGECGTEGNNVCIER